MSKTPTNWESVASWKRLMASVQATGVKIDYKETAKYFGLTADAISFQFRKVRKDAAALQEDVKNGTVGETTPSGAKSTKSTPKSKSSKKDPIHTVVKGRITKTPTKKRGIKAEPKDDDAESATNGEGSSNQGMEEDLFSRFVHQDEEEPTE